MNPKLHARPNTPAWDIALSCAIENRNGLLLVEAKANESELGAAGKVLASKASANSAKNHARVAFRSPGSRRVLGEIAPTSIAETRLDCGAAPFWLLVRSRQAMEQSPARVKHATAALAVAAPV